MAQRPLAGPAQVKLRALDPATWPHKPTADRTSHTFRATWAATKALLATEAGWLGAPVVVVQFDVIGGDGAFRVDGDLRANARAGDFPGVRVSLTTAAQGALSFYAADPVTVILCGGDDVMPGGCPACGGWLHAVRPGGFDDPGSLRVCSEDCVAAMQALRARLVVDKHLTTRDMLCDCPQVCAPAGLPTAADRAEYAAWETSR